MKQFHKRLPMAELFKVMKLSSVVEAKDDIIDWGDEQEVTLYIRKKPLQTNEKFMSFFGHNIETIK